MGQGITLVWIVCSFEANAANNWHRWYSENGQNNSLEHLSMSEDKAQEFARWKRQSVVGDSSSAKAPYYIQLMLLRNLSLVAHNKYRREARSSNMVQMGWNNTLTILAGARFCQTVPREQFPLDQNIYYDKNNLSMYDLITTAVQSWHGQKTNYNYPEGRCKTKGQCDTYLKIVTAHVYQVGCTLSSCGSFQLYVCNYFPAITSEEVPFTTGAPCAECSVSFTTCTNELCNICRRSCRCGVFVEPCQCECLSGYMGDSCDKLCKNLDDQCGVVWPKGFCDREERLQHILPSCPLLCGVCTMLTNESFCQYEIASKEATCPFLMLLLIIPIILFAMD